MKLKISLLLAAFILAVSVSQGQDMKGGDKYVFVISKINYLKAIEDAVSTSDPSLNISEVRVILCGESVKAFEEKNPLIEKTLHHEKIKLYACGLSLEQMKVNPRILTAGVGSVRNGLLEAMILEKKGYKKMDL
ncbi:MAG: hypothetical protein ABIR06_01755 [Cyclobacteriaceae bacterium]